MYQSFCKYARQEKRKKEYIIIEKPRSSGTQNSNGVVILQSHDARTILLDRIYNPADQLVFCHSQRLTQRLTGLIVPICPNTVHRIFDTDNKRSVGRKFLRNCL